MRTIVTFVVVLGCSNRTLDRSQPKSTLPRRGDQVLIESSAAQFYQARVISEETMRLRVQAVPSGDTTFVPIADVYRLPAKVMQLAPHSLAICNIDHERWVACRVAEAGARSANVNDVNESSYQLPWPKILSPNALTELNLKRLFDRARDQRDFEHDMSKAGPPRLVPGWQPTTGKPVIAKVDGKWWLSTIVSERHGQVRITFSATDRMLDVARNDVAPEPPYPMDVSQKSSTCVVTAGKCKSAVDSGSTHIR